MFLEIIEEPIHFQLYGFATRVQKGRFGEAGMQLMNRMWRIVKATQTATTGINHWVYLPDKQMFVGIELSPNAKRPDLLEPLALELQRYLKHVHVGPYQALPAKWASLKAEVANHGETMCSPSLEIYGHHCEDSSKLETTILIGLKAK